MSNEYNEFKILATTLTPTKTPTPTHTQTRTQTSTPTPTKTPTPTMPMKGAQYYISQYNGDGQSNSICNNIPLNSGAQTVDKITVYSSIEGLRQIWIGPGQNDWTGSLLYKDSQGATKPWTMEELFIKVGINPSAQNGATIWMRKVEKLGTNEIYTAAYEIGGRSKPIGGPDNPYYFDIPFYLYASVKQVSNCPTPTPTPTITPTTSVTPTHTPTRTPTPTNPLDRMEYYLSDNSYNICRGKPSIKVTIYNQNMGTILSYGSFLYKDSTATNRWLGSEFLELLSITDLNTNNLYLRQINTSVVYTINKFIEDTGHSMDVYFKVGSSNECLSPTPTPSHTATRTPTPTDRLEFQEYNITDNPELVRRKKTTYKITLYNQNKKFRLNDQVAIKYFGLAEDLETSYLSTANIGDYLPLSGSSPNWEWSAPREVYITPVFGNAYNVTVLRMANYSNYINNIHTFYYVYASPEAGREFSFPTQTPTKTPTPTKTKTPTPTKTKTPTPTPTKTRTPTPTKRPNR